MSALEIKMPMAPCRWYLVWSDTSECITKHRLPIDDIDIGYGGYLLINDRRCYVVSVVGAATEVCGVYFFQTDHRFLA